MAKANGIRCCTISVWCGEFSFANEKETNNIQQAQVSRSVLRKQVFGWDLLNVKTDSSAILWLCAITQVAEETIKNVALFFWHSD